MSSFKINMTMRAGAAAVFALATVAAAPAVIAQTKTASLYDGVVFSGAQAKGVRKEVVFVGKATVVNLPSNASDVLVSSPDITDAVMRTARQAMFIGKAVGQTNAVFFDAAGRKILTLDIYVEHDTRELQKSITRHFPNSQVKVESLMGDIILTGSSPSSTEANGIAEFAQHFAQHAAGGGSKGSGAASPASSMASASGDKGKSGAGVINHISVTNEEQVMIKVRVAEVTRDVVKRLGIDLSGTISSLGNVPGNTLGFGSSFPLSLTSSVTGNGKLSGHVGGDGFGLDSLLQALERHGFVHMLAEPSLTAVTGEKASFFAGGEFPIPSDITTQDGQVVVSVGYQKFGVALDFTPVVINENRISLNVKTGVSNLTSENSFTIDGVEIPGITSRTAETTVEVPSGGSIVLAGMLQQETRRLSSGVPGLRQLPVLGGLFRSEEFRSNETELVILATPYVVKAGRESDFKLPTDGFARASDFDMYFLGRMNAVYGSGQPQNSMLEQATEAPLGFIME